MKTSGSAQLDDGSATSTLNSLYFLQHTLTSGIAWAQVFLAVPDMPVQGIALPSFG
eukprot:CAMPEP_0185909342 /NCGR_PEP_ID=MMETSP0196C-20130402/12273_1 /TAXON_ID=2932 /ORGANISM="Alexandrium fundyense, Strain CCMP1719" /LENGTH=55 /DNA_ID=CAMNT_0028629811 /DNA_START=1 /DNA_END=168 /DNA_ORIENTATION=+